MPSVTIVIPCFNASHYIERCIRSIANQTFKDFCVIAVDDYSSDSTVECLNALKNKYNLDITILCNDYNRGPAYSRNRAIKLSKTPYITFCDADDWYESEFLNVMYSSLAHFQADICFCGHSVINDKGKTEARPIIDNTTVLRSKDAFYYDIDSLCMLMVKTDIMKKCPLPPVRNGEDVAVIPLLLANTQKCVLLSECLYNYYRRTGSASQKPNMKVVDFLSQSFDYTYERFPDGYRDELEFIGIKNLIYSAIITLFSFSYDTKKADNILDGFEKRFPRWKYNPHVSILTFYKRIIVIMAKKRHYLPIKIIAIARNILNK